MELIGLKTEMRTGTGNGPARVLRREGKIPAILYGPDTESVMLSVNVKELETVLKTGRIGQTLLNLEIQTDGEKATRSAIIKEWQQHPLSGKFLHVDFYEISMDRKIRVMVPVVTKGKAKGVELGGILQIIRRELEVLCYPREIPENIEIDITDLDMGESVHVREIPTEGDIEIPADVDFTVLTVVSPKSTEEEEEEGEEEGEEGTEEEAAAEETAE